jgi:predicted GNAT family acetyltransferase
VQLTIQDVSAKERFEAHDETGALAGFVTYQVTGNIVVYTHTETQPDFAGHGVGSQLARAVLQDAKDKGRTVVLMCPFISSWVESHHEFDDIIAKTTRRTK